MEERWGVTQNVFHLKRKGLHNYRISTWCTVQFQIGEWGSQQIKNHDSFPFSTGDLQISKSTFRVMEAFMKDFHRKLFLYYLVMVPEIISIKNGRI